MQKILEVVGKGLSDGLRLIEMQPESPREGEVRISVEANALNRADILYIDGNHYTDLTLPSRIGSEACGYVDAVGAGVKDIQEGDRVSTVPFFSTMPERHGVHGEFAIVPAEFCAPWPKALTEIEGCSIWMQYLTAYFSVKTLADTAKGDTILVIAGASSAGIGAIQIAKTLGANVIATTRTQSKVDFLRGVGADHVIVTDANSNFDEEIQAMTAGEGVKFAFDPVCGDFLKRYVGAMAWDAKIAVYGMLGGVNDIVVPILDVLRSRTSVHAYSMYNYVKDPLLRREGIEAISGLLDGGGLRPVVDRVFELSEFKDAYTYMVNGAQCGKIVMKT